MTPSGGIRYPDATTTCYEFRARDDMLPVEMTWYDGGLMLPGIASLRTDATLHYDADDMRVTHHDAVSGFLTRAYREGYSH